MMMRLIFACCKEHKDRTKDKVVVDQDCCGECVIDCGGRKRTTMDKKKSSWLKLNIP